MINPIMYEPLFDIPDSMLYELGDKKIGDRVKMIIDYECVEKTKSYTVLRINFIFSNATKRLT